MTTPLHAHDKDALIHRIGELIVGDAKVASVDWQTYALIAAYVHDSLRLSGFAYPDASSYVAATPQTDALAPAIEALRQATRVPQQAPWQCCIVRIVRATGKIHVEFEYDDPQRWDIGPDTLADVVECARPASPQLH